MQNIRYNIWQDENGWHGYLEGFPKHDAHGDSFQDLQVALWQLQQHLIGREWDLEHQMVEYSASDSSSSSCEYSEDATPPAVVFRSKSPAEMKRRARVELLMLVMIMSMNGA